jgi:hypothetical protein
MDEGRGAYDRGTEGGRHRLHPEADPSKGRLRSAATLTAPTEIPASSGSARTGRDDDATQARRRVVGHLGDGTDLDGVVADDMHLGPGRLECLHEVEGEAVVVVDDEDHGSASRSRRFGGACAGIGTRPPARWRGGGRGLVLGLLELRLRTDPATIPRPCGRVPGRP